MSSQNQGNDNQIEDAEYVGDVKSPDPSTGTEESSERKEEEQTSEETEKSEDEDDSPPEKGTDEMSVEESESQTTATASTSKGDTEELKKPKAKFTPQENYEEWEKLKKDEELEKLKAEKVVGMIERIENNDKLHSRMIYLTNWQANAISNSHKSIKSLIDSFCGKKRPKLIIHLVQSWGFYNSTKLQHEKHMNKDWSLGVMYDTPPFKDNDNLEELNSTMTRLTHFMSEVIIPLAERTNALIICNAVADDCVLTETFISVLRAHSSRWNGAPMPFTVLKTLNQVEILYKKVKIDGNYRKEFDADAPKKKSKCAEWMGFMQQNTNWNQRHRFLDGYYDDQKEGVDREDWWRGHDLNWSDGDMLVVEGLDKSIDGGFEKNHAPFGLLLTNILDTYSHIPTLAIKTGATPRSREKFNPNAIDTIGYQYLVNRVNSETHVLLLDVREREVEKDSFENFDGVTLDDDIMKQLFPKRPECESLDCCALSFFGKKLLEHDKKKLIEHDESGKEDVRSPAECEMNQKARPSLKQKVKKGPSKYLHEMDCKRYSKTSYQFVSELRKQLQPDKIAVFKDYDTFHFLTSNIRTLLMSGLLHCKNVFEKEDKLIEYIEKEILFRYHRPRTDPPYEGLKLLEKAWEYVDKTRADAVGYQKLTSLLTLLQICLGLLITILTAIAAYEWNNGDPDEILTAIAAYERNNTDPDEILTAIAAYEWNNGDPDETRLEFWLAKATLLITLLLTAVVSIDALLTPKAMWRQLRLKSTELESLIWKYRAGVQEFELVLDTLRDPEDNFEKALTEWKEDLHTTLNNVGATMIPQNIGSLKSSVPYYFGLKKSWTSDYKAKKKPEEKSDDSDEYEDKKTEEKSHNSDEYEDDNYSYVLSKKYLEFRLETLIEIYERRIPKRVWMQQRFQIYIILVGILIAFVAEMDFPQRSVVILVLTAIVAAIKSWSAFRDIEGDLQLYPRAINAMRNKQMEWEKRTMHQQQDMDLYEDLVVTIEGIAMNVVESWSKSLSEKKYEIPGFENDDDAKRGKSKKRKKNSAPAGLDSPV